MQQNEVAHALAAALKAAGVEATATGSGVHWQVDVAPGASHALLIHCFWYERAPSAFVVGLNPGNARSRLRTKPVAREGAEYLVIVKRDGVRVADGRALSLPEVVACARTWIVGADLDALGLEAPFVDRKRRAMCALAARLEPHLRWDIGGDPSYELWVYGEHRSCKIVGTHEGVACSFFIGQAQVAHAAAPPDVPAAVSAWLRPDASLHLLSTHVVGVEVERHAAVLETDPAGWHWIHLRDREV